MQRFTEIIRNAFTPSEPPRALRLHEVLRAEHEYVAAGPDTPKPAAQDADATAAGFELVDGAGLAARVTNLLATPPAGGAARSPSAMEDDRQYGRLAEWVAASRGANRTAGAGTADGDGGAAAAVSPAAAADAPVSADEIRAVLAARLGEDLPRTEPWLQNAELRPLTRGLLARHLGRRSFRVMGMGPAEPQADPELNRLLLEDAFAKHVRRRDDREREQVFREMRESGRAALCLSGGGIRSATFALGVVQGLARHGVLGHFRYLSTVSGGGYLGGWLSAWSHHEGFDRVLQKLDGDTGARPAVEAAPVRHLRQYSNYLSPRLGVLSADTWTLVATFLRNLLLVWLVLVPLLAAVAAIPWLVAALMEVRPSDKMWGSPEALIGGAVLLASVLVCRAVSFVHAYRPETDGVPRGEPSRQMRRDQAAFLRYCLLPLALGVILWSVAWQWFAQQPSTLGGPLRQLHALFDFSPAGPKWYVHDLWSRGTVLIMAGGALLHLVGWLFALRIRTHTRRGWRFAVEMAAILGTGAAAGLLVILTSALLQQVTAGGMQNAVYATLSVPGFLASIALAGFAFEGVSSRWTEDAEREWSARYSAWLLIVSAGWLALMGTVLFGPHLLQGEMERQFGAGVGLGSGILTALLGRSPKTAKEGEGSAPAGKKRDWSGILARLTLPVAAAVGVVALAVAISLLDMALLRWVCSWEWGGACKAPFADLTSAELLKHVRVKGVVGAFVALYALGRLLGWLVETNRFSLHAMYRARLIRAYLGASRPAGERKPDPFTGFDEADNLYMGCLAARPAGAAAPPFHVVNLALNLVAGRNLAWQERKAASFTVSPLHAGAATLGYRRTHVAGQACPSPEEDPRFYGGKRGITLGTAMTISGAAASPNMGYHSSPAVTFLMTLFNVRLGWWLGNPGPAGDDTFHLASPRSARGSLRNELLGATDDTSPYVYLSDGGHFENLGIYEMVLRRNRLIVVSDAGCDEACSLQDLGNAIRKIRIDLGIPIEFDADFPIRARSADAGAPAGRCWAMARVRYSSVDAPPGATEKERAGYDGVLLYIKPGIYGGEPRDVFNYAAANAAFPHESTADQFFSESQFESYRALGSHAVDRMVDGLGGADELRALFGPRGWDAYLGGFGKPAPPAVPAPDRRKIRVHGVLLERS
jgi:Patatin-like phospholipase